jgi:tRNA modification GTPase
MAEAIAAIATAISPDQGSVGIVRLSGDGVVAIAQTLFRPMGKQVWESHRVLYGHVVGLDGGVVDEVLVLLMLAPRSYTREDVVEFHCHGGIMAVQQVLQLCLVQGARLAHAGEFTLRAFLNGRLDLTQAESVMDLVGAKSPQAAAQALAGLQGRLAQPVRELRSTCLDILAQVEARIDFADDLPPLAEAAIVSSLQSALEQVREILATADRGELLRTGLKVAIVGRPNVGKSSLLNAWSRSDRAIVTDLPGTTRDVVESQLVVGGIPVQVLDTAGIRETEDRVESLGVERSRRAAEQADLVLFTIAADQGWTEGDEVIFRQVCDRPGIIVVNKIDLVDSGWDLPDKGKPVVRTAAALKQGIVDLEGAILGLVRSGGARSANLDFAINQRQAGALQQAQNSLEQVQVTIFDQMPLDFWTIDLRSGIRALSEVLGEDVTESMLDRVFGQFCIGK